MSEALGYRDVWHTAVEEFARPDSLAQAAGTYGRTAVASVVVPYQIGGAETTLFWAAVTSYEYSGHNPIVSAAVTAAASLVMERLLGRGMGVGLKALPRTAAAYVRMKYGESVVDSAAADTDHEVVPGESVVSPPERLSRGQIFQYGATFGSPGTVALSFLRRPGLPMSHHVHEGDRAATMLAGLNGVTAGGLTGLLYGSEQINALQPVSDGAWDAVHSPWAYPVVVGLVNAKAIVRFAGKQIKRGYTVAKRLTGAG